MPIELGPKGPGAARAVGAVDAPSLLGAVRAQRGDENASRGVARAVGNEVRNNPLDPGEPPVDAERVAQIRKAIENGSYPVVPAKIADAMIAAGLLLRIGK